MTIYVGSDDELWQRRIDWICLETPPEFGNDPELSGKRIQKALKCPAHADPKKYIFF
jgi:hypothetical protein